MNRFLGAGLATSVALGMVWAAASHAIAQAGQAPAGAQAPAGGQGRGGAGGAQGAGGAAPGAGRGGGLSVTGAGTPINGQLRQKARAEMTGQGVSGTADFNEYAAGNAMILEIVLNVQGLPPGLHGMHVHAAGKCEGDFTSAGGHFDPGPAGNPDADVNHPYHSGDLPNITVGANGTANVTVLTTRFNLGGPLSLVGPEGTALIIHANPDLLTAGAAGSGVAGGPRIACGVIKKQ